MPPYDEIKQQVAHLRSAGNSTEKVEAIVEYRNSRGLKQLRIAFGHRALFPNGDLSFAITPPKGENTQNGILLVKGTGIRISTPWSNEPR